MGLMGTQYLITPFPPEFGLWKNRKQQTSGMKGCETLAQVGRRLGPKVGEWLAGSDTG